MKTVTVAELHKNFDDLLEAVIQTGMPLIVDVNGRLLRVECVDSADKLQNLIHRPEAISGDPEKLVHMTWPTSSS
jgi:hypothetical protein